MKRLVIVLTVLFIVSISSFVQMSTGQDRGMMGNDHGGGMMGNNWGWGMGFGFGWVFIVILVILAIFGIVYMMKRK